MRYGLYYFVTKFFSNLESYYGKEERECNAGG
jgi:hypothetical protein